MRGAANTALTRLIIKLKSGVQCSAIRDGGQHVAITLPMMFARGIGRQMHGSPARLSAITK